ncbi:MAG: hypothetical protein ACREQ5_01390 [Candidatus Dormibacteria bacterium]
MTPADRDEGLWRCRWTRAHLPHGQVPRLTPSQDQSGLNGDTLIFGAERELWAGEPAAATYT